jgi:hypothetical protein
MRIRPRVWRLQQDEWQLWQGPQQSLLLETIQRHEVSKESAVSMGKLIAQDAFQKGTETDQDRSGITKVPLRRLAGTCRWDRRDQS